MQKFKDMSFNAKAVKERGFEHFEANVKDLAKRQVIGERVEGKIKTPTDAQIKARYDSIVGAKPSKVEPAKVDK